MCIWAAGGRVVFMCVSWGGGSRSKQGNACLSKSNNTNPPTIPPPPTKKQQMCRLLKHALRSGKTRCAPLLDGLLHFLCGCYCETRNPSLLYAASIVVGEFGDARPVPRGLGGARAAEVCVGGLFFFMGGWVDGWVGFVWMDGWMDG